MNNLYFVIPMCVIVIAAVLFWMSYYVLFKRKLFRAAVYVAYFSIFAMGLSIGTLLYRGSISLLSCL